VPQNHPRNHIDAAAYRVPTRLGFSSKGMRCTDSRPRAGTQPRFGARFELYLDAAIGCGSATGRGWRAIFDSDETSNAEIFGHPHDLGDSHIVAQTLHTSAVALCPRHFFRGVF